MKGKSFALNPLEEDQAPFPAKENTPKVETKANVPVENNDFVSKTTGLREDTREERGGSLSRNIP